MIRITFCGHHDEWRLDEIKEELISQIESYAKNEAVEFWLGGYGNFDSFALKCCKQYKTKHPSAKLIFVTPYLDPAYLESHDITIYGYDGIVMPPVENTPPKYAILKRNEYMVNKSDYIIAYINHGWGGAAKMLEYAIKRHKTYINIGTYPLDKQ